jgi:hypothetical protein
MRNLLVFLGLVLLLSVLASCESRSQKAHKLSESITDAKGMIKDEFSKLYTIDENVLIVDEVFTIKAKYTGDRTDIVYTLYKNDVFVPKIYTYHNLYLGSSQPITDIKDKLMKAYAENHKPKIKPFIFAQ